MKLLELRTEVAEANRAIVKAGLVLLTWGNVSAIDRSSGLVAIKPSGISYDVLSAEDIPLVDLENAIVVEGRLNPSSDTATHLEIYRSFPKTVSVVHTHSHYAVCFAQCNRPIPCLGTTHADHFLTAIPCTRKLLPDEINGEYEANTGRAIVECFSESRLDPEATPGVLVSGHGPFAWGANTQSAVENAIVLEEVARMAADCSTISAPLVEADRVLVERHFYRKHGSDAYYGQKF